LKFSAHSVLIAGVTTLTVSAVAIAPSVQPPPPRPPVPLSVQLAANVQPYEPGPHLLQILLTDPVRLLGPANPIGTITPPPAPTELALAPNLADSVDNIYLWGEPWVRYGFQVATDLLGWVPWVGWLSGQIMVFYTFFEGMVASGTFNVTDWLRGDDGAVANFVDWGIDVGLAWAWLGIDEWNYFLPPLPPTFPRPPRPPFEGRPGPNFLALLGLAETPEVGVQDGGEIVDVPSSPPGAQTGELAEASEISTVPSMVNTAPFNPAIDSGRGQVAGSVAVEETQGSLLDKEPNTVGNARNENRTNPDATEHRGTPGVVQAQGQVRTPVAQAGNDSTGSVRAGRTGTDTTGEAANAPKSVAKDLGDTVKPADKDARRAANDVGNTAKNNPTGKSNR
jgi:hypothetical protein